MTVSSVLVLWAPVEPGSALAVVPVFPGAESRVETTL